MIDAVKAARQGLTPKVLEEANSAGKVKSLSVYFGYSPEDLKWLAVRWGLLPDVGLKHEDIPLLHKCFDERKKDGHRSPFSDANLALKFCCDKKTVARRRVNYGYIGTTNTGT